ncbi:MAG: hypothetical protein ACLRFE_03730, partial [Clostridia bacterium]
IEKQDKQNEIYDKVEQNRQKYLDLMAEDDVENAIKFNQKLNERLAKLGIKTCTYVPKEDNDGKN